MTAQIGDLLIYQGERLTMCNAPLGVYFRLGGAYPEFEPSSTALIRGYVATWELLDDRLYLIAIQGWLSDGTCVIGVRVPGVSGAGIRALVFRPHPGATRQVAQVRAFWLCECLRA